MIAAKLELHKKRPIQPGKLTVGRPMVRVNIDTIGPFQEGEEGNKYIMVFIDVFSRFIELVAVRDLSALTAAKRLIKYHNSLVNRGIPFTNHIRQCH
jgi:hypothetical protein